MNPCLSGLGLILIRDYSIHSHRSYRTLNDREGNEISTLPTFIQKQKTFTLPTEKNQRHQQCCIRK